MIFSIIIGLLVVGYLVIKFAGRRSAVRYLVETYYLDPKKLRHLRDIEVTNLHFTLESFRKKEDWESITKYAKAFK
jgi:hypothetical protein